MKEIRLPQTISDGRLDTLLKIFATLKQCNDRRRVLTLNWTRVAELTPAGYGVLACLFDTAIEQKCDLKNIFVKKKFKEIPIVQNLMRTREFKGLPDPTIQNYQNQNILFKGTELKFFPQFMDLAEQIFQNLLTEDLAYFSRLVLNELMVNCVDHSTAERYYLYAGKWGREFHLGILDMGITIPAKLERKYIKTSDVELLELSLKEGITTRRQRVGGLGLFHIFEVLKNKKGRLTILSRDGQVRRYFNRRSLIKGPLKFTLDGTWCFARFPL